MVEGAANSDEVHGRGPVTTQACGAVIRRVHRVGAVLLHKRVDLVQDLHDRGLDKDVSVVVWGEFGRTPVINKSAGRDHWPKVSNALIAGGGMRMGQIIGSTTKDGGEADDRPVTFQEVFATLYHSVGIDVGTATVNDLTGRPRYLVDQRYKPMPELI